MFYMGFVATMLIILVSCSLQEWRDVGEDALQTVPTAVTGAFVGTDAAGNTTLQIPDKGDALNTALSILTGLVSGWYGRKFVEKRYQKKTT